MTLFRDRSVATGRHAAISGQRHGRLKPSPRGGSMKLTTDKVLAGIAGILAVLALLGIGAPVTMLAIAVILLAVMVFI